MRLMAGAVSPLGRYLPAMVKRPPEPSKPITWDIFRIAKKSVWIGAVEALDKQAAVEKAAREFKTEALRLYAVKRR